MGGEEWIQSEGLQGDKSLSGLQEDTGIWRGEGIECRNPVEEDEAVRGSVGARGGGEQKYSKRRGRTGLMQGYTGKGKRGKQKRTQCGVQREPAVDVWRGE